MSRSGKVHRGAMNPGPVEGTKQFASAVVDEDPRKSNADANDCRVELTSGLTISANRRDVMSPCLFASVAITATMWIGSRRDELLATSAAASSDFA
jgi:hypothetical protein